MKEAYDRMNPTLPELLERLRVYAAITYGTPAYPLSGAEARLLIQSLVSNGTDT